MGYSSAPAAIEAAPAQTKGAKGNNKKKKKKGKGKGKGKAEALAVQREEDGEKKEADDERVEEVMTEIAELSVVDEQLDEQSDEQLDEQSTSQCDDYYICSPCKIERSPLPAPE